MKPSVLVAEDEGALVTLLRYNLEREGYRVLEAQDGEEALLVAAEQMRKGNQAMLQGDSGAADLSYVEAVVSAIARAARKCASKASSCF